MPRSLAASTIGAISADWPNRCTGMIAFVRGVIAAIAAFASMLKVSGSLSTSTGRAPTRDDAAGGGEERIRRCDDFVAGADVERHQRREHRVGARRQADGVRITERVAQLSLEAVDFGTADEALAVANAGDGIEQVPGEAACTVRGDRAAGRSQTTYGTRSQLSNATRRGCSGASQLRQRLTPLPAETSNRSFGAEWRKSLSDVSLDQIRMEDLEFLRQLRNAELRWFFDQTEVTPEAQTGLACGARRQDQRPLVHGAGRSPAGRVFLRSSWMARVMPKCGSILLSPRYRGQGVMTTAIGEAMTRHGSHLRYFSEVLPDNNHSLEHVCPPWLSTALGDPGARRQVINVFQPELGDEELAAVKAVMQSNWTGRGKITDQFEAAWSSPSWRRP